MISVDVINLIMFKSGNSTVTYLYLKRSIAFRNFIQSVAEKLLLYYYFVFSKPPVSFLMENNSKIIYIVVIILKIKRLMSIGECLLRVNL